MFRGVVVQFELGRMILSQMMTVYVPTLLIMTVSYLTTFFNNRQWFGHIITINLTVRLPVRVFTNLVWLWICLDSVPYVS
jgi:hypothetical protein